MQFGINIDSNKCLGMKKDLYGLKHAPGSWNERLHETLLKLKFKQLKSDSFVHSQDDPEIWLSVYVDDGLILALEREICMRVVGDLNREFKTKNKTGSMFLGMEIEERGANVKSISQRRSPKEVVERFRVHES